MGSAKEQLADLLKQCSLCQGMSGADVQELLASAQVRQVEGHYVTFVHKGPVGNKYAGRYVRRGL